MHSAINTLIVIDIREGSGPLCVSVSCPEQTCWRQGLSKMGIDTEVVVGKKKKEGRSILGYIRSEVQRTRKNVVDSLV